MCALQALFYKYTVLGTFITVHHFTCIYMYVLIFIKYATSINLEDKSTKELN